MLESLFSTPISSLLVGRSDDFVDAPRESVPDLRVHSAARASLIGESLALIIEGDQQEVTLRACCS